MPGIRRSIVDVLDRARTPAEPGPGPLTAESLRMNFMANSESTSVDSVGRALETMARKN